MKTLDEVIAYFDNQTQQRHVYLTEDAEDIYNDALHYLKDMKNLAEDYDILYNKYWREFNQQQANPALTWGELRTMEGKPVWVEWTKSEESYWCFGEWFDDDEMRIYRMGCDYADYIHKTIYTSDIVQAYRKERE